MSEGQLTAIAAIIAAIGAVIATVLGYLNRRKVILAAVKSEEAKSAADVAASLAAASQREIVATKDGIRILGERIDGQLDKLLAGARAEGHAQGEQAQRDRSSGAQA